MKQVVQGTLENVLKLAHEAALLELESEVHNLIKKKDIWLKMAEELESQNYPKIEIYSIIHKMLQDELRKLKKDETIILNSGHLYDTLKEKGYTKQSSAQKIEDSSLSEIKQTGSYAKQRDQFIKFHQDLIEQAKANIEELQRDFFIVIENGKEKEERRDWGKFFESPELWSRNFKTLCDLFYADKPEWDRQRDSRQSLLPKMRLLLVALTSVATNKWVCSRFFAEVKNITSITPKKLTQYLHDASSTSDLFHNVKDDAWLWNFVDIECPKCKEYRLKVKIFEDGTWEFVCKNWEKHNSSEAFFPASLFDETLKQLSIDGTEYLKKRGIEVPNN